METIACGVNNHLDKDVFLPPRKRLLAGFKRQNSDVTPPSPLKADILLSNSFIAQSNLSYEDIIKASRFAAKEATKVAEAAKAKAEGKAAKAAKAVAAARNALDLVATLSEETAKEEQSPKKNKMRKRVTVEELYNNKNKGSSTNSRTDEEMARNLHRAINSSSRILINSDMKSRKHKKVKRSGSAGRVDIGSEITNGGVNQTYMATSNGGGVVRM